MFSASLYSGIATVRSITCAASYAAFAIQLIPIPIPILFRCMGYAKHLSNFQASSLAPTELEIVPGRVYARLGDIGIRGKIRRGVKISGQLVGAQVGLALGLLQHGIKFEGAAKGGVN